MKPFSGMRRAGGHLRQFALGAVLACAGLPAAAQTFFDVGGFGTIGDTVLPTVAEGPKQVATLKNDGVPWTVIGGEGIVYSRLISRTLTVPTTGAVTLKFKHRYFLEAEYDGGAVYISVNGGPATYVNAAAFTQNGYAANPLIGTVFTGGERVFNLKSPGYDGDPGADPVVPPAQIESIANLGSLNAGDTIAIEFRGGWDDGYVEAAPNWEIGSVKVTDAADAAMLDVNFLTGPSGFTVISDLDLAKSWRYLGQISEFELDADTPLSADRYATAVPGPNTIIDLNGSELSVVLLEGTVEKNDTFSLFDLSGGTTLRGDYHSISLPPGTWDVSQLKVNGTITCKAIGGGLVVNTFDTIQGPVYLDPISNLLARVPSGTGPQTADITYGNFLTLPGLTSAESFTVLWDGWLDVTIDGQGDYTFGTQSDDGSVVFIDANDDGDFSDAGERVVNNNRDQGPTVATGTVTLNTNSVRVLIGFYENGGGEAMTARFKKGSGLAWNALQAIGGTSGHFSPVSLTPKNITSFSVAPYGNAEILENRITFKVTNGGPINALAPVITIDGSSVSPASGVPQDFTQPVTYTVTASNGSTREFVATALVIDLPVTDGLAAWLKADSIQPNDATQGRIFGSSAFVTRWNDQSGNRQYSTQATAASQPRYLSNDLNGLPTVKWDGTSQFLRGGVATTVKTIFAVCKKDAEVTGLDGLFCASPSQDNQNIRGNGTNWAAPGGAVGTNGADFPDGGQVRVNGANASAHNGQWHILMEESATAPVFAYQLGQTSNNRFLNGRIAEVIIYDRALTQQESDAVGSYLADKYALTTVYPAVAPQAKMYAFGIPGWPGVINEVSKTVSLTVPFSTDLTTLAPTFTLSGGATSNKASGSAQNFTAPVAYTVTSSDSAVSTVYTVTVTKATVRTDKQLLSFGPGAAINGTDVLWSLPYGSSLAALSPALVVSPLASVSPVSGATQNFTNPVAYTVTAEDGSTQVYTVTASVGPAPPTSRKPALWLDASQLLGLSPDDVVNQWPDTSGSLNGATRTQGSPLYKTNVLNGKPVVQFGATGPSFSFNRISNIRSVFWVLKENAGASADRFLLGDTDVYDFHRGAGSNGPIWSDQYASPSIQSGTTRLMGEVKFPSTSATMPADSFQLLSLVTTGNVRANTVTLDRNIANRSWNGDIAEILIYDAPLSSTEEAEIGSYLTAKYGLTTTYPAATPLANLYSIGLPGTAFAINQTTKTVSVTVPFGTDVTALAPTYVISGGATCDKPSGSPQNFTNPVIYTVTSSDSLITNAFTVTVTVAPQPPSATVPVLWLDASKLTGLSDGQQVDTWFDWSGLGNHAVRSGGAPLYRTSVLNGRPVVRFDTGSFSFSRISTIRSVFWVLKENAGASQPRFLLGDTDFYDFHRSDGGPNGPPWSGYTSGSITSGNTKLMGSTIDGAAVPLPSGSFQVLSVVTTGNVRASTVSNDRNIANRSWVGDIAEILIYDQPLTAAEELQVGNYLSTKYGLHTAYTYVVWAAGYPGFDLTNPAGDADSDGLTNEQEFAFGLNPTLGSSVNPITVQLNKATGTFTYTRRNPALTGLGYKVWTTPDLKNNWAWDQTATQTVVGTVGDVQTVNVTLSTLPTGSALFVRVTAP